ncbi:MAG: hypothetical protein PSX36_05045 [bacterium]|nr:hypothetical protein [bacterium]
MKDLKATLLTNWNFMRWLRLVLGVYVGVQAILMRDPLSGLISVFFLYQSLTNTGCCGVNSCETPTRHPAQEPEVVKFEEIKSN